MANSPKMFQADVDAGVESKNRAATLGNMLTASRQFVTGPGQFETAKNALMSTFPGLGRFVGLTNESVAAANDFSKLSAQLVAAQNAGSDKRMDLIEAATPSIVKSPEGVDLIIRQLQGNEDYLQARAKLAQKYPDQNDYRGFQAQLQQLDPRVFQYQRMTQPQRDAWRAHTDKRTVDEITASAAFAKQQGLL